MSGEESDSGQDSQIGKRLRDLYDVKSNKETQAEESAVEDKNQKSPAEQESEPTEELEIPEFDPENMGFDEEQLEELERIQKRLEIIKKSEHVPSAERKLPFEQEFIDQLKEVVPDIIEAVVNQYQSKKIDTSGTESEGNFYNLIKGYTKKIVAMKTKNLTRRQEKFLIDLVVNEVLGYGPITPLIHDESVSEIMVNDLREVYVERHGKTELTDIFFVSPDQVKRTVDKVLKHTPRSVDYSSPSVDATLPDGSRVHVIIPPLTPEVPKITIRKFGRETLQIEDLIDNETLTPEIAYFLGSCVKSSLNIIIAGGTSTGKTTLLNILSSLIPSDERILTIEDTLELKFHDYQDNVIRLQTRDPNVEGVGEVTATDLIRDALRMRPDRIIVGEVRGDEFLDMIQAMNTGHDGSFTTVHANSPEETIFRLVNLAMLSKYDMSEQVVKRQIGVSVDLLIQIKRLKDGSRKISRVSEVTMDEQKGVLLQDIFAYQQQGIDSEGKVYGEFKCLRRPDSLVDRFHQAGIEFPERVFESLDQEN